MVSTVKGLLAEGFGDIIVVDDGSRADCGRFFKEAGSLDGVKILTHETNRGKGRAMKTAFSYLMENRRDISGVITVDGDGQHLPADIKRCVLLMEQEKDKLILGVRDFSSADIPLRSRFGNELTKLIFRIACGVPISDTQTGLRAIPAQYLQLMTAIDGERYEYETRQLLSMKSNGIAIKELVIETVYIDNNDSSHFHPIRDSLRIYEVILKFMASSLASFLTDIVLFTACNLLLAKMRIEPAARLFAATAGARAVSSLVNYAMNRKVVFRSSAPAASSLPKYYLLCVCQMALSYGIVWFLADFMLHLKGSLLETALKMITDVCLFLASFQIQQKWVFQK